MYTQKIALIFDHIQKNNLEVYKPKTFYSGALAREARQRSTMGKKIW